MSTITNFSWRIRRQNWPDLNVTLFRGNQMQDWQSFFNEVVPALQFPYYFGNNLNAFNECIRDLDWLNAKGYLLIILKSNELLFRCEDGDLKALIEHLDLAAAKWSQPVRDGQAWDRDARPFHVIFHAEPERAEQLRTRFARVSVKLSQIAIN